MLRLLLVRVCEVPAGADAAGLYKLQRLTAPNGPAATRQSGSPMHEQSLEHVTYITFG